MVHLPTEIWARALSFLHKSPPSEEAEDPLVAQWADYSQAGLARCMRVTSVFYLAASAHLYRCPTTKDLPIFLYGVGEDHTCVEQQPDTASYLPSHRASFHTADSTAHGAPRGCCATRRVREPKAELLALVQRLHILQPAVDIPRDISLRLAFAGWPSLIQADHAIVLAAAQRSMHPLSALLKRGILSQRPLPNLSCMTVSSCNEYTWRSLELGGTGIPAFETLLSDCRRVIPALVAALGPRDREWSAVDAEWVQQATHGPFVLPAARLVDLASRPVDNLRSSITDGDERSGITFTADQRGRGCCYPPIINGSLNVIIYGQPQRERWRSNQDLVKAVLKMLGKIVQGFDEDLKDGTVVVLKVLLETEREESEDGAHARDAVSSRQKAGRGRWRAGHSRRS